MNYLKDLERYLVDPKYLHKMLEWGQAWGLLFSVFGVLFAVVLLKDRKSLILSLLLTVICCLLAWPTAELRATPGPIDVERAAANARQVGLRQKHAWIFYAEAAVAAIAICTTSRAGSFPKIMLGITLIGAFAATGIAFWLQARELQLAFPALKSAHNGKISYPLLAEVRV